jgi:hypothetical protein
VVATAAVRLPTCDRRRAAADAELALHVIEVSVASLRKIREAISRLVNPVGDEGEHLKSAAAQTDSPGAHRRCQPLGQVVVEHGLPRAAQDGGRREVFDSAPISSLTSTATCRPTTTTPSRRPGPARWTPRRP